MFFLIEYNRKAGKLVAMHRFDHPQWEEARKLRIDTEVELNRNGLEREVVLLEADSEADLRRTHQRYFASLHEIIESGITEVSRGVHQ